MTTRTARKKRSLASANLTETIRQVIRDSGQTVYAISKGAGISNPVTIRFMSGERDIRLETAEKLCAYLGLKLVQDK